MSRCEHGAAETARDGGGTPFDAGRHEDAVSRAYYVMFHAAKALLLERGSDPRTHAGVASELGKLYRDELGSEMIREFARIQEKREQADYGELPDVDRAETADIVDTADAFLSRSRDLLSGG
ncbi:MAG: HEPN domain-containing protein [Candidatus Nanohaloarchaea archaeon]|nr:HEPN domain-containing protein [Candidatus Nanohaloarchaea archaeon]